MHGRWNTLKKNIQIKLTQKPKSSHSVAVPASHSSQIYQ